jgi:chromosome segregation ATPase
MGNVIPFDNPLAKLRREFEEKELELQETKKRLQEAQMSISAISSVNELLKLQLHDLLGNITRLQQSLSTVTANVNMLQSKLPTIEIKDE